MRTPLAVALLVATVFSACSGGSSPSAPATSSSSSGNPVPTLSALSPTAIVVASIVSSGQTNTTLILTGTGFISGSIARVEGQIR
jgi:hypothetical protein